MVWLFNIEVSCSGCNCLRLVQSILLDASFFSNSLLYQSPHSYIQRYEGIWDYDADPPFNHVKPHLCAQFVNWRRWKLFQFGCALRHIQRIFLGIQAKSWWVRYRWLCIWWSRTINTVVGHLFVCNFHSSDHLFEHANCYHERYFYRIRSQEIPVCNEWENQYSLWLQTGINESQLGHEFQLPLHCQTNDIINWRRRFNCKTE